MGRKADAKAAVDLFVASFETPNETKEWVFSFLETEYDGYKIRHEIYEKLIYPVLIEGYLKKDAKCTSWLARTQHNFHGIRSTQPIHIELENKGKILLFEESYNLDPNEDVRSKFLESWLDWFDYSQHEWPSGILDGMDGADIEGCEDILKSVEFVKNLDLQDEYKDYLADYEAKVREYIERLQNCEIPQERRAS